ncbi:hypothetical protein FHR32_003716 [Streptosporangium album]|uniref:Uncharacterized protein n=1 Tax=Streptosporangium album TaxID=47479 RepID=A0A7W7RWB4_9ACTN|nr:hypothetical protein [Streptosporangium album]MBB4939411.1 hypothetical protein [Streptosporangium album]
MSLELPAGLASLHGLLGDDAPWPDPDEDERLRSARAWFDLGEEVKAASAQLDHVAELVSARNSGDDVDAFDSEYNDEEGLRQTLAKGGAAANLTGLGTLAVVLFRVVWKGIVIYSLAMLLLALMRAALSGPSGGIWAALRVAYSRRSLRYLLERLKLNIGQITINTVRQARGLLSTAAFVTAGYSLTPLPIMIKSAGMFKSDEQARRETEQVLNATPMGREALAWAREHGVAILYQNLGDTWAAGVYTDWLNIIQVDTSGSTTTPADMAAAVVHEVNHARRDGTPDPLLMSREEYIAAAIDEEAAGEVLSIKFGGQYEKAHGSQGSWSQYEYDYHDSYENAVKQAETDRRNAGEAPLTASERQRIGEQSGQAEIAKQMRHSPYPQQFGDAWDKRFLTMPTDKLY